MGKVLARGRAFQSGLVAIIEVIGANLQMEEVGEISMTRGVEAAETGVLADREDGPRAAQGGRVQASTLLTRALGWGELPLILISTRSIYGSFSAGAAAADIRIITREGTEDEAVVSSLSALLPSKGMADRFSPEVLKAYRVCQGVT